MIYPLLYIGPGIGVGTIALVAIVLLLVLVSLIIIIWTPIKKFFRKVKSLFSGNS
jgi:F0F1-type ATP synthase membrane subunit b/b'